MSDPKNILVIRFGSLGDIVLTSPATLNLKINFPFSTTTFLTKSAFKSISESLPGVDEVITIPEGATLSEIYSLALSLDERRFDLVIDLHRNLRSRFVSELVSANQKVSYGKSRLKREALVRYKYGAGAPHTIDSYNQALKGVKGDFLTAATTPQLGDGFYSGVKLRNEITTWRAEGRRVVFVAPGARHETKRAPLELFSESLKDLASRESIGVINAYREVEGSLSIADSFPSDSYLELVDEPLPVVTAHLAASDLALSNDSGVAHIASAVGTPVLTLFGPTDPRLGFAPRGVFDQFMETDQSCRPCSLHGSRACSRTERFCFNEMSITAIATKLTDLLVLESSLNPALFLDRDGTVILERDFLSDPEGVELHEGVGEALRKAQVAGFDLIIVSNQSGVARGYFTEEAVDSVNQRVIDLLEAEGVTLAGVYYCPNHPAGVVDRYRKRESGRKPADTMFLKAARKHGLDLRKSWVVGDRRSDYLAAFPLRARSALVKTGYGTTASSEPEISTEWAPYLVATDLREAVEEILALASVPNSFHERQEEGLTG